MDEIKHQEIRRSLINICEKALAGELGLEEFYRAWPSEVDDIPFYNQIYNDVEDGVEHLPGFFFKKGIDYKAWVDSLPYLTIYLDYILLETGRNTNELAYCRKKVYNEIESRLFTKELINKKIKRCLEKKQVRK